MLYTSLTTRNLSCTSFPFRVSSASFLWFPSETPALSRTTCATHFLALPATADRVLAMDAGCGSSTRGLWDGPGTCNESLRVAAREQPLGERFHVNTLHRHVWALLSSALAVLQRFHLVLPAVHRQHKLWAEYADPQRLCRCPAGGQTRCLTPVSVGCPPKRRCTHHQAITIFLQK